MAWHEVGLQSITLLLIFQHDPSKPTPAPRSKMTSPGDDLKFPDLPDLPAAPSSTPSRGNSNHRGGGGPGPGGSGGPKKNDDKNEIDFFDDLTIYPNFEELKKRK